MNIISSLPSHSELAFQATRFLDLGQLDAAKHLLDAVKALDEVTPETLLTEIRLFIARQDLTKAIGLLDHALLDHPRHTELRKTRADVRHRIGDWAGAAQDAAEIVSADPADAEAKARLGAALLQLGHPHQAILCLDEALAADPSIPGCREALATAFETTGDTDTAIRVLLDGIMAGPPAASLFNAAIMLFIRVRNFKRASDLAEEARHAGVADAVTFGLMGHALCSLDRHEEAASAYQEALKLAPDDQHIQHLAMAHGITAASPRAPAGYIRQAFDEYALRFESHLASLGYDIPCKITGLIAEHPRVKAGEQLGPVLDLGCGTGLVGLELSDLAVGPLTGVDLSPQMLGEASRKKIYAELREADIMADLLSQQAHWPLIIAADVVSYFGDLGELLAITRQRLQPNGWFVFSVEEMLADQEGVIPGNGRWALGRQGRYAHALDYIYDVAASAGLRIHQNERCIIRREAGADVEGILLILTPIAA